MHDHDFALHIGEIPLLYDLPFEGKAYHSRSYLTKAFLRQLTNSIKESLPRLDLWSPFPFCLIVADFDKLPKCFLTDPKFLNDPEDWAAFRSYLRWRYSHFGLVLSSPSGKAKILFKLYMPLDVDMTLDIAHDTLNYLLEDSERDLFDREPPAARYFFMNQIMYQEILEGLDHLPLHSPILDSVNDDAGLQVPSKKEKAPRKWNLLPADSPALDHLEGLLTSRADWFLARFLGGSAKASLKSIALGQDFLARQTAIHLEKPLSQSTMFHTLQRFIEKGLLKCVEPTYWKCRQCMRYQAQGVLRLVMEEVLANLTTKAKRPPVDSIPDGMWEKELWRMTNYFNSEDDFLDWADTLPGIGAPKEKRRKKAKRAWAAHIDPKRNKRLAG